jgi:peptide chain release factor
MPDPYISQTKRERLALRMKELDIDENGLVEKFIVGSGKGGQKINKTSSCVYLKHKPTGIVVKCQRERSREMNRFLARRELCDRIAERILGLKTERRRQMEKIRRQKRRRSRRQKERMLQQKHRQSEKKKRRTPVRSDTE